LLGSGFRMQQFAILDQIPLRDNHPPLELPAPLEWVRPVGQMVRCPPLEVGPLDGNLGEYGDGFTALLPLPCPLLQLLFCETSH
jgi:hypothetical protein